MAFGNCTCGCPDGDGQHLVNCEIYLKYWDAELLEDIVLWVAELKRPRSMMWLLQQVSLFCESAKDEASVPNPIDVIREAINRSYPVSAPNQKAEC